MTAVNLVPSEDKIGVWNASESTHDEALIYEIVKSVLVAGTNTSLTLAPASGTISINGSAGAASATETAQGVVELATSAEGLAGTDTTRVAPVVVTQAMIQQAIDALVDASPGTLDTLNEIAAALGDDPNFAATMTAALAAKANSAVTVTAGAGLSGGGDLTANRVIASTLGDGTRNELTAV